MEQEYTVMLISDYKENKERKSNKMEQEDTVILISDYYSAEDRDPNNNKMTEKTSKRKTEEKGGLIKKIKTEKDQNYDNAKSHGIEGEQYDIQESGTGEDPPLENTYMNLTPITDSTKKGQETPKETTQKDTDAKKSDLSHSKVRQKPSMDGKGECNKCEIEGKWLEDFTKGLMYNDISRHKYLPPPQMDIQVFDRYRTYPDPYDRRPLPPARVPGHPFMRERVPHVRPPPEYYYEAPLLRNPCYDNYFERTKVIMSHSTALCGVCCLRHLSKPSTGWCLECEEGLCIDCKEYHSLLKATRNHTIIPITEYQKLPHTVLEITRNCKKHNEILQIFCKKHDSPCCRKCIIETHNNCKNLIEIEDYIKDIKTSARFQEVEQMMNETAENIQRIRINREENLTSLQVEKKKIENDIVQTRIKINNHLDKLQADLVQTLYAKVEKENEKIQQVLKSLEKKQCQIKEYQNTFENIKEYATDVQLFLSMKLMETNIEKDEEFVQSLIENESLCQVMLVLEDTIDTETITVSMPYIGKVDVEYSPSQVSIMKKKEKQAQTKATKATIKSIANIFLKIEKKISACEAGVTGCTILPHGKIAFANEMESSIIVVKADGLLDFTIDLQPFTPFDITYISNTNTIAVTSRGSNDIKIVDVNTKRVLKKYSLDSPCAGITYTEERLMLCNNTGIHELNQQDGSVKTIVSVKIKNFAYVVIRGDKIYYTHFDNHSVTCCDFQGQIQWTFQNREITGPLGVTVDTDGNVLVAGNRSQNVVVISSDGKQQKQLLSFVDGIEWPHGLIYDRDNNQLLVTNYSKGALLYNVK